MSRPLFLASRSPRRAELLRQLGFAFEVLDVEVDEVRDPRESPAAYVGRVAREKAEAGRLQVAGVPGAVVIGADTEVMLPDEVLGKPADAEAAGAMLRRLSDGPHQVLTVVWCMDAARAACAESLSTVEFGPLDPATIAAYVASGEPFGKAGGYAIQGRAAAFVRRIDGSYPGVVGLPLFETAALLRGFGVLAG